MRCTPCGRGFALTELLTNLAIIAVLASVLMPIFIGAQEKARQLTCLDNQRQIAMSLQMYAQDFDETMPPRASWSEALTEINELPEKIWDCPTTTLQGTSLQPEYAINKAVAGHGLGDLGPDPTTFWMTADGKPNIYAASQETSLDKRHQGCFVLSYADTHVEIRPSFTEAASANATSLW
ncbi:MAG: type II secretion system protein [Armatimonadota bacterium]